MILAGDIGGTKTHLAFFSDKEKKKWVESEKFKSADHESLNTIVKEFLSKHPDYRVARACFGIAGPIQDRKCKATNLPWVIDADLIEQKAKIPRVFLINDLEANAFGIQCLDENEFFYLNRGKESVGNQALISAGTGLGEAGMFWNGKSYHPFACEGGHCSFAPENDLEIRLLKFLQKEYDHVSFERVLSGPGLIHLYRFVVNEGVEKERTSILEEENPAKSITELGMKRADPACARALNLFVSIYGSEAANWALKMLAVGGLYIGGGIAPKILNELEGGNFMKRFIQKGRFTSLLLNIPVKVVLNEHTALLGAALYARENH